MTETAGIEASLRHSREATVLAHLAAENQQDVEATLTTFKSGAARTELPGGEIADGPRAVAETYRELFTALPDVRFDDVDPGSLCHHGDRVICESRIRGTHQGPFAAFPLRAARSTCRWWRSSSSMAPTCSANAPITTASPCSSNSVSHGTRTPWPVGSQLCSTTQ